MYQPVPLNWMAGAEASFSIGPPQVGQALERWVRELRTSSNIPSFGHSYS